MHLTRIAIIVVFATGSSIGQLGTPPRLDNNFSVILKQGGIVDLHTMEELDQRRQSQVETASEATLSRWDLKAPGAARSEYNKGLHLLADKQFQKAVNSFSKAISRYPEFVSAHNALGCAYFQLKENVSARDEFTRAIQLDDHLSSSYLNLGRVNLALGQLPAAEAALNKAFAIAPMDVNLPLVLGYVEFLNRDYAGAIRTAQQVHRRGHSGEALVHYFAAASWQAQGDLGKTRTELETFLAEDPQSTFTQQARDIIQEIKSQIPVETSYSTIVSTKPMDSNPSLLGQKVLQDINEKKEIAEAEVESGMERDSDPATGGVTAAKTYSPHNNLSGRTEKQWSFHTAAEEVAVYFTAADHGKSVTDLREQDISIKDDNKAPAAILSFLNESKLPLHLGLLIDTSMSVKERFSFEQKAAINFLRQMLTGNDDGAFIAGFSNSVILTQDFTRDSKQLAHGIDQLVPIGGTALWDAVGFAADKLVEGEDKLPVARVLVVISDGDDNSSRSTLKQAIETAERAGVVIYSVSTRDFDPANDLEIPGNHALRVLAEHTGGSAFFPGSLGRLNHSLTELQQVIRSRYLIGYKPAAFAHDGRYRPIAITAARSGRKLTITSRKGYYTDTAGTHSNN